MIYFDSAATTLQKPPEVAAAMQRAVRQLGSPGRGGHSAAMKAAEAVFACRETAAQLFGVEEPERVVFTMNSTHALNIAIKSIVRPGDRVLVSGYEHNSVMRPLKACGAETVVVRSGLFSPRAAQLAFESALTEETRLVVCTYVSNVFGFVLPIEQIAQLCRERRVPLIIDASQAAGVLGIDMDKLGAAFIAMPGHKGLYGPQGTGLLLCGSGKSRTLMEGGSGSESVLPDMPEYLPDRLEAGTHNVPGIVGLLEGLRFVKKYGPARLLQHERNLMDYAARGLESLPGVRVFRSPDITAQTGVLSFLVEDKSSELTALELSERGFALRAGLHCSPEAHRSAATLATGTVRLSLSAFNTRREVSRFLNVMESLTA